MDVNHKVHTMNKTKIVVIDSDKLGIQPALNVLRQSYSLCLIDDVEHTNIDSLIEQNSLFLIDPNAFQRKALGIYRKLIAKGANVIAMVYPDESVISESECLSDGALDFIIKPISPAILSLYIEKRMRFVTSLKNSDLSTTDFIQTRQSLNHSMHQDFIIDLVEDSQENAQTLFNILQPECDIRWFNTVERFYERDISVMPHLYILDIVLNGQTDGYDLLEHLKKTERFRNIPILFLTGSWQRRKVEMGLKMGASDYIRKVGASEESIRARIHTNLTFSIMSHRTPLESEAF